MKDIDGVTIKAGDFILYAADDELKYGIVIQKKNIRSRYSYRPRPGLQVCSRKGGYATIDVYGRIRVIKRTLVPPKLRKELSDAFSRSKD